MLVVSSGLIDIRLAKKSSQLLTREFGNKWESKHLERRGELPRK